MIVEIRQGERIEYEIVEKCGRYRVRYRTLDRWFISKWRWFRVWGIYDHRIEEAGSLHDAEVLRDNDIRSRKCAAAGWKVVG